MPSIQVFYFKGIQVFIENLNRHFLMAARACDKRISSEVHGKYNITGFYKNHIANNKILTPKQSELLKALYFAIIKIQSETTTDRITALTNILNLWNNTKNQTLKEILARLCHQIIAEYQTLLGDDYKCLLEINQLTGSDLEIYLTANSTYAELCQLHLIYVASQPSVKSIVLTGYDDTLIKTADIFQYSHSSHLRFWNCPITSETWITILDTIIDNHTLQHITIDKLSIDQNSMMLYVYNFIHHKLELRSLNVLNNPNPFANALINDFLLSRYKLIHNRNLADLEDKSRITNLLYDLQLIMLFVDKEDHFALANQTMSKLRSFIPQNSIEDDIYKEVMSICEMYSADGVNSEVLDIYKRVLYIYNYSRLVHMQRHLSTNTNDYTNDVKFCLELSEYYSLHLDSNKSHDHLRQLIFATICIIKSSLIFTEFDSIHPKASSAINSLLAKCLKFYTQKKSANLNPQHHYTIYSCLYRFVFRVLTSGARINYKNSIEINPNECSFQSISACFTLFNKIFSISIDEEFKLFAITSLRARFTIYEILRMSQSLQIPINLLYSLKFGLYPSNNFGLNLQNSQDTSTQIKRFISLCELENCEQFLTTELDRLAESYLSKKVKNSGTYTYELLRNSKITKQSIEKLFNKSLNALTEKILPLMSEINEIDMFNDALRDHESTVPNFMQSFITPYDISRSSYYCLIEVRRTFTLVSQCYLDFRSDNKHDLNWLLIERDILACNIKIYEAGNKAFDKCVRYSQFNEKNPNYHYALTGYLLNPNNVNEHELTKQDEIWLRQQQILLGVCNARLIQQEEYAEKFISEKKQINSRKKIKKANHRIKSKNSQFVTPGTEKHESDTEDASIIEDSLERSPETIQAEIDALGAKEHYERASKYIELADYYLTHQAQKQDLKICVDKAKSAILQGRQACADMGVSDSHFDPLDFALYDEDATAPVAPLSNLQLMIKNHQYLKAIKQLEAMTQRDFRRKPLLMLADLYSRTGQYSSAESCLIRIMEKSDDADIEVAMRLTHVYFFQNKIEPAIQLLSKYDEQHTNSKLVNDARLRGHFYTLDYQSAQQLLNHYYKNLKSHTGKFAYAKGLDSLGLHSKADKIFTALLTNDLPNDLLAKSLYQLIGIKIALGEFKGAEQLVNQLQSIEPYSAMVNRARVFRSMNKFKEAEVELDKAISHQPENPKAYIHKAYLHLSCNEHSKASLVYEQAIKLFPNNMALLTLSDRIQKRIQVSNINNYEKLPEPEITVLPVQPLHLEFKTDKELDDHLKHVAIPESLKSLMDKARDYKLRLILMGPSVYHLLHGRSVSELTYLLIGDIASCRNFISMQFKQAKFTSETHCCAFFNDYQITVNIQTKLDLVTQANLNYSTMGMLFIDEKCSVQDPCNVRYQLLLKRELKYNDSFAITQPLTRLSCIRDAFDNGLKLMNREALFENRGNFGLVSLADWLEELPKVARSKSAFYIIMDYCALGLFEFLVPRAHVLALHSYISSKNFFQAMVQHLDYAAFQQATHPGLCMIGQLLILLDYCDLYCVKHGQEPEMLIEEFRFKDQLSVWQRHELLNYVKKYQRHFVTTPTNITAIIKQAINATPERHSEHQLRQ